VALQNMTLVGNRWIALFAAAWLGVVGVGLFVPLMDNDSAHHANIALRMYLTGDYVNLVDYNGPYLDKPHLHFWLAALSYHLFGVTGFAYKFPSLVFSLIGIWAVYRSGVLLINRSAGIVAAIVYATSASFLLALNDVRMDAILTACVAISVWQVAGYWSTHQLRYVIGTAFGVALGFCTKGHIGVLVPLLFALSYSFFSKDWKPFLSVKILWGVLLFFLFISPVVYCYYLQYNLNPDLVVRGKDQINGIRFILWEQSLGRYSGEMGGDAGGDKFFFLHTFLWVFAPWSLLGFFCLFGKKDGGPLGVISRSSLLVLVIFGVLVGFSSFKLPHYLNVILPLSALWVAEVSQQQASSFIRFTKVLEWLLWGLIGLVAGGVLVWWFPQQPVWFWVGLFAFFFLLFYTVRGRRELGVGDYVLRLAATVLVIFWILNAAFYKSLLLYQGGNRLAQQPDIRALSGKIYSLEGCYSSSFYFYTRKLREEVTAAELKKIKGFVLLDKKQLGLLEKSGVVWKKEWSVLDYEITKLTLPFLDPQKRAGVCTALILVELGVE
jgi:hypothetical protein